MENIIIEGTHVVYNKTAAEEVDLLQTGTYRDKFYYICTRGIHSPNALSILAQGEEKYIRLQDYIHPETWSKESRAILEERGLHKKEEPDEEKNFNAFETWLYHNMMRSPKCFSSEAEYGIVNTALLAAGAKVTLQLSEKEETQLIRSKNWEKVKTYRRQFNSKSEVIFLLTAPLEQLFAYIKWFRPQTNEAYCAIILRGDSVLTWETTCYYALDAPARRIIRKSGNPYIWKQVVMRYYGFIYEFEHKFGSISKWQKRLEQCFNRKYFGGNQ